MLLAKIRGTKQHLSALAESGIHLHRAGVRKIDGALYEASVVLEESDVMQLELGGYDVTVQGDVKELLSRRLASALDHTAFKSSEDLFNSVQSNASYMDTEYIESWIAGVAGLFPELATILPLPNKTWQGRATSAIRLRAGGASDRVSILFTSGVHAGELGGPDSSIYFLYRLISAYQAKSPLILGQKVFDEYHIQDILEHLDIYVLPCVNPDGRAFVQTSLEWWRKNYNPNTGLNGIGVDINRNFDFLWSSGIGSSHNPIDDTYRGAAAFSEPETRNVQWLLKTAQPDFFMDIHGPSGALVYCWGDAQNQSVDPTMSFLNPDWDGKRNYPYQEYLGANDESSLEQLGTRIIEAANSVRGGAYEVQQSYDDLYSTTATSDDYAYSRHLADAGQRKTYAYTFEYGGGEFFPPYADMLEIIEETNAAMLGLCDAVVLAR